MYIYLLLQIIVSIIFFISFIYLKNQLLLKVIIVLPIAINFITSLIYKSDNKLKISLLFAIIADYLFIFIGNIQAGISCFIVVQIFYMLYIRKLKINIFIIILTITNCIIMLLLPQKYIVLQGTIYGMLSIFNIYTCYKLSKKEKIINKMKLAIILLFICDLIIGIRYIVNFNPIITIILKYAQWISYIPSQMLIVLIATKKLSKQELDI